MGRHSPADGQHLPQPVVSHTHSSRHGEPNPHHSEPLAHHSEPNLHQPPVVGKHSSPASPSSYRLSRAAERAEARRQAKRAKFRRLSAVPVTCVVLSTFFANDAYHLISPPASASERSGLTDPNDLSALASSSQVLAHVGGSSILPGSPTAADPMRVSRFRRTPSAVNEQSQFEDILSESISSQSGADVLPARPDMPKVDPYKTVAGTWVRPSAGGMSTCFCMRWGVFHEGIDLAGPLGSPIVATGPGVVLEAGPAEGFGHWIVIQQSNGDVTIYGHMFTVLVSKGDHVSAGQHIANIGDDGEATGPHLHFGVRQGGIDGPYIDPVPWLRARGVNVGTYDPKA